MQGMNDNKENNHITKAWFTWNFAPCLSPANIAISNPIHVKYATIPVVFESISHHPFFCFPHIYILPYMTFFDKIFTIIYYIFTIIYYIFTIIYYINYMVNLIANNPNKNPIIFPIAVILP